MENKIEVHLRGADSIGVILVRMRKRRGWTQAVLSEKSRIPQSVLSFIESGKRIPELKTLFQLCYVLGIDLIAKEK